MSNNRVNRESENRDGEKQVLVTSDRPLVNSNEKRQIDRVKGPYKNRWAAVVILVLLFVIGKTAIVPFKVFINSATGGTNESNAFLVFILLGVCLSIYFFSARIGFHLRRIAISLKSNSADEAIENDDRPVILYLRSFSDDNSLYPDHEQELVDAFAEFGPVIGIGKPGESLQKLGAARVYVGDDWIKQIEQWADECSLAIIRLGETEGLKKEIEVLKERVAPMKILIQLPQPLSVATLAILNQFVFDVSHQVVDFSDRSIKYIFFDKNSVPQVFHSSLRRPQLNSSDPASIQISQLFQQLFPKEIKKFLTRLRRTIKKNKRSKHHKRFVLIVGLTFVFCVMLICNGIIPDEILYSILGCVTTGIVVYVAFA